MDGARPFLDEVLQAPDDDTPRLIYADWLEEVGDPRGEFIRVQCELDAVPETDPRYIDLALRNEELLAEHQESWASELKQDLRKTEFRRGFIETITMRARAFVKEGEALFQSVPVRWIRFNYVKGAGDLLCKCPALAQLRFLDLHGLVIPEADLAALLSADSLTSLEGLKLGGYESSLSGLAGQALANCASSEILRQLELEFDGSPEEFVGELITAKGFPALKELRITSYDPLPASLANLQTGELESLRVGGSYSVESSGTLAALPISNLKRLNVSNAHVPAVGFSKLAERGAFGQLKELELTGSDVGIRAMESVLHPSHLGECEVLRLDIGRRLSLSQSGNRYLDLLFDHPNLGQLRTLELAYLSPGQLSRLVECPAGSQLNELTIHSSHLDSVDVEALVKSSSASTLKRIKLHCCHLSNAAVAEFAAGHFPELLDFDLDYADDYYYSEVNLGKAVEIEPAVKKLIQANPFPKLQRLSLVDIQAQPDLLEVIASEPGLSELRILRLDGNTVSRAAVVRVLESENMASLRRLSIANCGGLDSFRKLKKEFGIRIQG